MSQPVSREQIREIVAGIVGRFEAELAAAGLTTSPQPTEPPAFYAPWTGETYQASHPSQAQFSLAEVTDAAPAARDLLQFTPAGQCSIEKGKPCDQCGACRVLGF
jgi:hypothetical protein